MRKAIMAICLEGPQQHGDKSYTNSFDVTNTAFLSPYSARQTLKLKQNINGPLIIHLRDTVLIYMVSEQFEYRLFYLI